MLRVLQVVTKMDRCGLETLLMNYYRNIDRSKVQFDFLTHREEQGQYDDEIEQLGGNIYHVPHLNPLNSGYYKALDDFFRTHPYNIVHSHLDCTSTFPLRAAKKAGVPYRIAHIHSTSQDKDFKYPIKMLSKKMMPYYATDFFACGEAAGKRSAGSSSGGTGCCGTCDTGRGKAEDLSKSIAGGHSGTA